LEFGTLQTASIISVLFEKSVHVQQQSWELEPLRLCRVLILKSAKKVRGVLFLLLVYFDMNICGQKTMLLTYFLKIGYIKIGVK
jgi:hypothetical protein